MLIHVSMEKCNFPSVKTDLAFLSISRKLQYKLAVIAAIMASAQAFAPAAQLGRTSTAIFDGEKHVGSGGMADTRDPDAFEDEDPRKSISAAPSFEEYLKQRDAESK